LVQLGRWLFSRAPERDRPRHRRVWRRERFRDAGVGFETQQTLEHLCEPFYTIKPLGMGIGLALSRAIIEAHGGRLEAEQTSPTARPSHSRCHLRSEVEVKRARREIVIGTRPAAGARRGEIQIFAIAFCSIPRAIAATRERAAEFPPTILPDGRPNARKSTVKCDDADLLTSFPSEPKGSKFGELTAVNDFEIVVGHTKRRCRGG